MKKIPNSLIALMFDTIKDSRLEISDFSESYQEEHRLTKEERGEINDRLDNIQDFIKDTKSEMMDGFEIIFDEIQDLKGVVSKSNLPKKIIARAIWATFVQWGYEYLHDKRIVNKIMSYFESGVKFILGS